MATTQMITPSMTMNLNVTWLKPSEFAVRQCKRVRTIQLWCKSGFIVELGFILCRDVTGNWLIGVPYHHPSYAQFA